MVVSSPLYTHTHTPPPPPPPPEKVLGGILESACRFIHVPVCVFLLCPSVYKIQVSVKALMRVFSHI